MKQAKRTTDNAANVANGAHRYAQPAIRVVKKGARFWTKLSEDWLLNFSGMLAYNYLTAIAPILLAVLAIGGLVLGMLSPESYDAFAQNLASNLPGDVGQSLVNAALNALRQDAGILLAFSLIVAIYSGSRLFVALDNVFAVIFRVSTRPVIPQNIMAILMVLLFLVLAPLSFILTSLPALVMRVRPPSGSPSNDVLLTVEGFAVGLLIAFIMFGAIYYIVPNRKLTWKYVWPGALVASALLNLYEALFPIYQSLFLQNVGYGSVVGLAVIVLIFFYYIGFITLLGAEINAWVAGLRPLGAALPELFRQERREGVGNAPGAPRSGISRSPHPSTVTDQSAGGSGAVHPPDARPSTP